jgi:hypothetical protein
MSGLNTIHAIIMDTLGELMQMLELRPILTYNPKEQFIIFCTLCVMGVTHDLPLAVRGARKVCFKLQSCL